MEHFPTLPPLTQVIAAHGLAAKKSLGQHFLLDGHITDEVVRAAGDVRECNVIEVGSGPGGLTRSLLKAGAKQLYVIEKDARAIAVMEELQQAVGNRLHIIHADALEVDLEKVVAAPRKIVANLPYNAGTPMLIHWLGVLYRNPHAFTSLTLMFQKEVAQRIVARGGKDFGRLSVLCQWLCKCTLQFELPPEVFSPPPKVDSAVVTLIPRPRPLVAVRLEILETVMAKAFGQRRKMLRQALKGLAVPAEQLLEKSGINATLRAEQLPLESLCNLALAYQALLP